MTLYLDLGSKGIRILAYPWFIRVIGTNKFPYIGIWISIFESENIDLTPSRIGTCFERPSVRSLLIDRRSNHSENRGADVCDSFHLTYTRGLNRFRWIYSDSVETTICSCYCFSTRSRNLTIDDFGRIGNISFLWRKKFCHVSLYQLIKNYFFKCICSLGKLYLKGFLERYLLYVGHWVITKNMYIIKCHIVASVN